MLRYRGSGPPPADDVARVHARDDTVVVDSSARMLVVEADPKVIGELAEALPDWIVAPEMTYEVPDTRQRVERPPD